MRDFLLNSVLSNKVFISTGMLIMRQAGVVLIDGAAKSLGNLNSINKCLKQM